MSISIEAGVLTVAVFSLVEWFTVRAVALANKLVRVAYKVARAPCIACQPGVAAASTLHGLRS